MSKFKAIHKLTKNIALDRIGLAVRWEDARGIYAEGKKVAMIGLENASRLGTDVSIVKQFYDLGARYKGLSYIGYSQFCDSNTGEEDDVLLYNGINELEKEVIK